MPQKKNPDGLELLRGRAGVMSGWVQQVMNVIRSLPSGYNRDFQDTKEPMIRGFELAAESVAVVGLTVEHLQVNEGALRAACTPELLATDMALKLVADGMSFRDAYREVGMNLGAAAEGSKALDIDEVIASRTAAGSPGNLAQESGRSRLLVLAGAVDEREAASRLAIEKLVPGFYA